MQHFTHENSLYKTDYGGGRKLVRCTKVYLLLEECDVQVQYYMDSYNEIF